MKTNANGKADDKVLWHAAAKQWYAVIGYTRLNKSGEGVRAYHYLGDNQAAAKVLAARKRAEWKKVQAHHKEQQQKHRRLFQDAAAVPPIWPVNPDHPDVAGAVVVGLTAKMISNDMTVEKGKNWFLKNRKERVNLVGKKSIKSGTYNGDKACLEVALKPYSVEKI